MNFHFLYCAKKILSLLFLLLTLRIQAQEVELVLPEGHAYAVNTVEFAPDGKTIVTSSEDNTAKIWEAESGKLLHTLTSTPFYINAAHFSPDSKKIITASDDNTAVIWDAVTAKMLYQLKGHTRIVRDAKFSPDGKKILSISNDSSVIIWDAPDGKLNFVLQKHSGIIRCAEFSPDSKKVVTGADNGTVTLWLLNARKPVFVTSGLTRGIVSVQFSNDGKKILVASQDTTASIWDAETGKILFKLYGHTNWLRKAVFSPDNKLIVSSSYDKTAIIWNAETGKSLFTLKDHLNKINDVGFSPDGKFVITSSDDSTAIIRNARNGEKQFSLQYSAYLKQINFSPDNTKVAIISWDRTVRIANPETGQWLYALEGSAKNVYSAKFSPDYKKIVTAAGDGRVKTWNSYNGVLLQTFSGHTNRVMDAQFSADGKKIVSASTDKTAKIWDAANVSIAPITLKGHTSWLYNAAFSNDGKLVVTASVDGTAKIWEAESGKLIRTLSKNNTPLIFARFSNDGSKIVITGTDYPATTWETTTGRMLSELTGHTLPVALASFSADDKKIVTAGYDSTAKVWDAASGTLLMDLKGHSDKVLNAFFTPDGKNIFTSDYDDTLRIWNASTGALKKSINIKGTLCDINWKDNVMITRRNSHLFLVDSSGREILKGIAFDSTDWVVIHASGLFDATEGAMKKLYWTKGLEMINFTQLKQRYWEPGLWEKVLKGEKLRDVRGMSAIKLQPEIDSLKIKDGKLFFTLTKREGGYGKIVVSINGKEIEADARGGTNFNKNKTTQTVQLNLKNNPLLKRGEKNIISVKTWSEDGFVEGRPEQIQFIPEGSKDTTSPNFYAVICGVSEYQNSNLSLRFAHTDATAIAKAVTLGAENLFGKANTHVTLFTSPVVNQGDSLPTKQSIKHAFEAMAKQAKPRDILVLYLSGHGITWGGEEGDFYYLTADAYSKDLYSYNDPLLRSQNTISTKEFTDWIKKVPASKQVMVIDACGSGKAVENLLAQRSVDADQVKAIDRMKDRTGMFIISGCAADALSYEASRYGQGLLTYALLQAMKGAQLREDKFVDVNTIINYAREKVPVMAAGVGGIQEPQLLIPASGSFDIGILKKDDKDAIPVAKTKPVFVRSIFINTDSLEDFLNLSQLMDDSLQKFSDAGDDLIFVDAKQFPEAYTISGTYVKRVRAWSLKYKIKKENEAAITDELNTISLSATELKTLMIEAVKRKIERIGVAKN